MKHLLLFLTLLAPTAALAQKVYTPEEAIGAFTSSQGSRTEPSLSILRQKSGTMSKAGVDAFADELALIYRNGEGRESYFAGMALRQSAESYGGGVPYERAKDILISVYESFEDPDHPKAQDALLLTYQAGAEDYVRKLFESSEPPPPCTHSPQVSFVGEEPPEVENPCPNKGTPKPGMAHTCNNSEFGDHAVELTNPRSNASITVRATGSYVCTGYNQYPDIQLGYTDAQELFGRPTNKYEAAIAVVLD